MEILPVHRPACHVLASVFAVACSILTLTLAQPAVAASFDCERGDLAPDEKAICDGPTEIATLGL